MKHIEDTWPEKFMDEVQNLQLNITMDRINPYSLQNTNYYVFPIVLINNNKSPWLSMNNENLTFALIVSSRRQVKNMDIYLQPLVNQLKELWERINIYYVSRPITVERIFMLYGICAYTTHDYPSL